MSVLRRCLPYLRALLEHTPVLRGYVHRYDARQRARARLIAAEAHTATYAAYSTAQRAVYGAKLTALLRSTPPHRRNEDTCADLMDRAARDTDFTFMV